MALYPPHTNRSSYISRRLAFALVGGVSLVVPAFAQQVNLLRGAVAENTINDELLGRSLGSSRRDESVGGQARSSFPTYQPFSAGAVDPEMEMEPSIDDPLEIPPDPTSIFDDQTDLEAVSGDRREDPSIGERREEDGQRVGNRLGLTLRSIPEEDENAESQQNDDGSDLEDRSTSAVDDEEEESLDVGRGIRTTTDNPRTGSIDGLGLEPQDDPFAPLGIRAGNFVLTPTFEQGIGWTSNGSKSPGGSESVLSESRLRLEAISDWSRHSASISADGQYRRSISGEKVSEIEGGGGGELRLDLGHELTATGAVSYRLQPEAASSPNNVENAVSEPLRQTVTGSAGLSKDIGKLRLGIVGAVVRDAYGDAELESGGVLSQSDRNTTLATIAIRGGYEISPALRPFIEAEYGRRLYDEKLNGEGYARSADRYALRGGVVLDLGDKLQGEIAAGWLTETPDDDRLNAISGASVQGDLAWSPTRGTTVELNASTQVEGTTTAGASGSLLYAGGLTVSRELRHDLTGTASIGLDWRDYSGSGDTDLIARGEASLTWWLNRYAGVTGRVSHELQRSTLPDRDYDETGVYLGMTLQR